MLTSWLQVAYSEEKVAEKPLSKSKLTWGLNKWEPMAIFNEPFKNQGINQIFINKLYSFLPEFVPEVIESPLIRTLIILKSENLCSAGMIKNAEREAIAYYSQKPYLPLPPLKMYINSAGLKKLGLNPNTKIISLKQVLQSKKVKGIVKKSRSYNKLDPIIKGSPDISIAPTARDGVEYDMVKNNRVDFFFEYGFVVEYLNKLQGINKPDKNTEVLTGFQLEESPNVDGYLVCSKNEWGKHVMDRINEVLPQMVRDPNWLNSFIKWLPEEERVAYKDTYNKFLSENFPLVGK